MGILSDIWWLLGILMAGPFLVPGAQSIIEGSYLNGALFLTIGLGMLFLPEYIRWQLTGGNSPFERVPFLQSRAEQNEE